MMTQFDLSPIFINVAAAAGLQKYVTTKKSFFAVSIVSMLLTCSMLEVADLEAQDRPAEISAKLCCAA